MTPADKVLLHLRQELESMRGQPFARVSLVARAQLHRKIQILGGVP